MTCSICNESAPTRYIDLYVFGSEGLHVCHNCELELSHFALNLALKKQRERKEAYLAKKQQRMKKSEATE